MSAYPPEMFLNRELSWLAFNERVLAQAEGEGLPLFERIRFFAIAASNLEEFFMVRVAGLKQQLSSGVKETQADGMSPAETLAAIRERVLRLTEFQDRVWRNVLAPGMAAVGIRLLRPQDLKPAAKEALCQQFLLNVFPALTPIALDPGHPFPHLRSDTLSVALRLRRAGKAKRKNLPRTLHAVVPVPRVLDRWMVVHDQEGTALVTLEDVIAQFAELLFPGFSPEESAAFSLTRNHDLNVDEEEAEDLLYAVEQELRRRDRGAAVRLLLSAHASELHEDLLKEALGLDAVDVYRQVSVLRPGDLEQLANRDTRSELHAEAFVPATSVLLKEADLFEVIRAQDVLLYHPYDSFDPVVRLVEEAADDPRVLAIKQTFYRTSGDSPFVRALSRAAENGKQVAALVEIKARFDEQRNIEWARRLEENGVHVVYGLLGLKTHCKACLIVRREDAGIRRYVHLGTGNYNPQTARVYTDHSLLTARQDIAEDVSALFNMLTGLSDAPALSKLAVAPINLASEVLRLIVRETQRAQEGRPALIQAKMNSLVDPQVIGALYDASQAGVVVDLLVRGICCLRPGLEGISDNIRVHSVVDRFLEHSRVFAFGVGQKRETFLASADWMPRNLRRRVEVMFPVLDAKLAERLAREAFDTGLADNRSSSRLLADGTYQRVTGNPALRSQMRLAEEIAARHEVAAAQAQPDTLKKKKARAKQRRARESKR